MLYQGLGQSLEPKHIALPCMHRTREGHWPMHNDVPREGEEEGLIPQPSNPRSATITYERHGTMCDESSTALTVLTCLFCRQQCFIPMDAHLNISKLLYEETPTWKKYQ